MIEQQLALLLQMHRETLDTVRDIKDTLERHIKDDAAIAAVVQSHQLYWRGVAVVIGALFTVLLAYMGWAH